MGHAILTAILILLLLPSPAWAYIDPGAGSYLYQILIASWLVGVYTLRRYWHQIRSWFSRRREQ